MKLLIIALLFTSCTVAKYGYAPGIITLNNGKLNARAIGKLKPLSDTTISCTIIKRIN